MVCVCVCVVCVCVGGWACFARCGQLLLRCCVFVDFVLVFNNGGPCVMCPGFKRIRKANKKVLGKKRTGSGRTAIATIGGWGVANCWRTGTRARLERKRKRKRRAKMIRTCHKVCGEARGRKINFEDNNVKCDGSIFD